MTSEEEPPDQREGSVLITGLNAIYNWGRRCSMWPLGFGLACCAFEAFALGGARFDLARFGMEFLRGSPRHADLMMVSGTVTKKTLPQIVRLYNQMAEPKYVLSIAIGLNDRFV
jgi:NADH-quinone oxidoreductase subunit B